MSMMIPNEFAAECCASCPGGGGAAGGGDTREGPEAAGAGAGPALSAPQSADRLVPGPVPPLPPGHHVLEVGLAPG